MSDRLDENAEELSRHHTTYFRQCFGLMNPAFTAGDFSAPMFIEARGNEYLSARDLADLFGLPYDALRKRLERCRRQAEIDWKEIRDRGKNKPDFLYEIGAVLPVIEKMVKKRPSGSGE